jgi:NADPH:quinone reductase-like Zn-dependent oxidoreductase
VNFHDIYVRSGSYRTLALPGVPGLEGVGVVEALGEGVTGFAPGDRVAYIERKYGGYARARGRCRAGGARARWRGRCRGGGVVSEGLTAQALVADVHPYRRANVLVQAAGGGVGQLVARMAKLRGATVIGTAGSPKVALARPPAAMR